MSWLLEGFLLTLREVHPTTKTILLPVFFSPDISLAAQEVCKSAGNSNVLDSLQPVWKPWMFLFLLWIKAKFDKTKLMSLKLDLMLFIFLPYFCISRCLVLLYYCTVNVWIWVSKNGKRKLWVKFKNGSFAYVMVGFTSNYQLWSCLSAKLHACLYIFFKQTIHYFNKSLFPHIDIITNAFFYNIKKLVWTNLFFFVSTDFIFWLFLEQIS